MSIRNPHRTAAVQPAAGKRAPEIQGSWQRCIEEYKLEPGRDLRAPRLTETEICDARDHLDSLLHSAEPVFDRLRYLGEFRLLRAGHRRQRYRAARIYRLEPWP
ncbi:hypothetical protein [Marinobacterium aestuariivivens]|uniref:Uncharacterized protein n=1 Tax=Marinobacterium aestuariivivens TaxID=1698799 RepID=A0ABW2A4D6_9GAMM